MYSQNPNSSWDQSHMYYENEMSHMDSYLANMYETPSRNTERIITEVWNHNLEYEFNRMKELSFNYPNIAIDTEFPGTVTVASRNEGEYQTKTNSAYFGVALSVNASDIIQLGMCLYNDHGVNDPNGSTWQFNFAYNDNQDLHHEESMMLLKNSDINIEQHEKNGIEHARFTELLIKSGLVMNTKITWITFHGGCDLAYLLKMCLGQPIPYKMDTFMALLRIYFPYCYDIRYIIHIIDDKKSSLCVTASCLDVKRSGTQHQAGSDSMVTGDVFFKFRQKFMRNSCLYPYCGYLFPFLVKGFTDVISSSFASFFPPVSSSTLNSL